MAGSTLNGGASASASAITPEKRKKILKVLFISLLMDLISFTFILPLFPSLLAFYTNRDTDPHSLLNRIFHHLNSYKNAFSKPIDSRYDVVLLGGALGSLFSFLQAIASPVIGHLSDKFGRRTALLYAMCGNIASVLLWVLATDFRTFLASRIVGGLSEGNVQLATAIATDISDESQRGSTMALVGACFSIAFTFGPALGAALANVTSVAANPFATAAGFSLFLIVVETIYIYFCLPETHFAASSSTIAKENDGKKATATAIPPRRNSPALLNLTHFLFLFLFSGLEFSLPFLIASTLFPNHPSPAALNGRLLGFMGLLASILQGSVVRRMNPIHIIRLGVLSSAASFFLLATLSTTRSLYLAGGLLAITSATVVTGLNSLGSLEAGKEERGAVLGRLRSWGQIGRAMGPVVFCSLFWWGGREAAYQIGGAGMLGVAGLVFAVLR